MQIRELDLTELETAYEAVKEIRTALSYEEFEDLVYDMRHQEYKMYGIFEKGELVTYAGVNIQVNLYWKRHLVICDLVTKAAHREKGYSEEMMLYLVDIARILQCGHIAVASGIEQKEAHRFYESEGFDAVTFTFVKKVD